VYARFVGNGLGAVVEIDGDRGEEKPEVAMMAKSRK
jgi:hypothetical protein